MRVNAVDLAAKVLAASNTPLDRTLVDDMATCISYGNGALRVADMRTIWMVLDHLHRSLEPDTNYPVLIRAGLRTQPRAGALLLTQNVASTFRDAVRLGIGRPHKDFPQHFRNTWAPAATLSEHPVALGGAPREAIVANTIDVIKANNEHDWYDLESLDFFPLGCVVYRIKANGALAAYQRVTATKWLTITVHNPESPVDVAGLLTELQADSVEPTHLGRLRPMLYSVEA